MQTKIIIFSLTALLFFSFSSISWAGYESDIFVHGTNCEVDRNGNNPEDIFFLPKGIESRYSYAKEVFCPVKTYRYYEVGDEYYYCNAETITHWYYCGEDNNDNYGDRNDGSYWYYNLQIRLCYHSYLYELYSCSDWQTLTSSSDYDCNQVYDFPDYHDDEDSSVFVQIFIPPKDGSSYSYFTSTVMHSSYTL